MERTNIVDKSIHTVQTIFQVSHRGTQMLVKPLHDIWLNSYNAKFVKSANRYLDYKNRRNWCRCAHDFNYTVEKNDIKNRNGRSLIICKKDGQ